MAQARIETIKQTEEIGLFTIRFEGDIATEFEKFAKNSRMLVLTKNYLNYETSYNGCKIV